MKLKEVSNEELLRALGEIVVEGHRHLARLLSYLIEVEERRLDHELACSSMLDFCMRRLGLGEDEAVRRIAAARLARRFPIVLELLATGTLSLSRLLLLRPHLTNENHEELLRTASRKTKREIQEAIAAWFPRSDVLPSISPIPP